MKPALTLFTALLLLVALSPRLSAEDGVEKEMGKLLGQVKDKVLGEGGASNEKTPWHCLPACAAVCMPYGGCKACQKALSSSYECEKKTVDLSKAPAELFDKFKKWFKSKAAELK